MTGEGVERSQAETCSLDDQGSSGQVGQQGVPPANNDAIHRPNSVPYAGQGNPSTSQSNFADELRVLKAKLLKLENLNVRPGDKAEKAPEQETEGMHQFQRMAECLYNHRKQWEVTNTREEFPMYDTYKPDMGRVHGPWSWQWAIDYGQNAYQRPNPFQPSHKCGDTNLDTSDGHNMDEYDYAIDFGQRRDRIRKTFEWEMDRLYLTEETEKRRRQKIQEAKDRAAKAEAPEDSEHGQSQRIIRSVDWDTFKGLSKSREKKLCAIDILIGEPVVQDLVYDDWFGVPHEGRRTRKGGNQATNASGEVQSPERIRITSSLILKVIDKVLKATGDDQLSSKGPVVFTRPFKILSYCEAAFSQWCLVLSKRTRRQSMKTKRSCQDLAGESGAHPEHPSVSSAIPVQPPEAHSASEAVLTQSNCNLNDGSLAEAGGPKDLPKMGSQNSADDTQNSENRSKSERQDQNLEDDEDEIIPGSDDVEDFADPSEAFDELSFFTNTAKSQIFTRREYLRRQDCQRVFFSDLWHLFRPGVEVIGSNGKQAYRVIYCTSLKHRMLSAFQKWSNPPLPVDPDERERKPRPDFHITCVYIDFDGKKLGPVARKFEIKPFDGERDISSFEVFPLRLFHERRGKMSDMDTEDHQAQPFSETTQLREKLIRRGGRFLEAIATKHMFYSGPTLDTHEDVEGQVVVDFEAAFPTEALDTGRPQIDSLPSIMVDDYEPVPDCASSCCEGERVFDDTFIDFRQYRDYLNSLLPKQGTQEAPSVLILPRTLHELQSSFGSIGGILPDDELLLLSNRVFGFILRSRKFNQLNLEHLSKMATTVPHGRAEGEAHAGDETGSKKSATLEKTFDRLVLEDGHKDMIVSLISQHFRDKEFKGDPNDQVDVVRGKGKGLILLLHGAPGVGKTSTAEGVAELFGKPLFQITCGDLGTTAREVEQALEKNFALANRWGCVLLLDEADVFLAERTKEDFKRNGLVAVFLRVLEYYAGILFLTTNRVGDFDEAFTSRIHMSLYYPELSEEKTVKVFQINMEMITERFTHKKRQIKIDHMNIGAFATQHYINHPNARWNGRQIRNACQTALALAEFQAQGGRHDSILRPDAVVNLTVEHFETVRNAYLKFTEYMNKLYGSNAARKAKEGKLRAIWVDENELFAVSSGVDGGIDMREAFRQSRHASQMAGDQQYGIPRNQHSQSYPQQNYPSHQMYQVSSQGYSQPQQQNSQQSSSYRMPSQTQAAQYTGTSPSQTYRMPQTQTQVPQGQVTGVPGRVSGNSFQPSHAQPHSLQTPQFSHQQETDSEWFDQNTQEIYTTSNQLDPGRGHLSHLDPSRGGVVEAPSSEQHWGHGSSSVDPGMPASFDRVPRGGQ